jgi:hypothetical protein
MAAMYIPKKEGRAGFDQEYPNWGDLRLLTTRMGRRCRWPSKLDLAC